MALANDELTTAEQVRDEISKEDLLWFNRCSFLFGAELDLQIVRWFVEVQKITFWRGNRLVQDPPSWNDTYPINALLFAMDSRNMEVVHYLFQEWNDYPVSINVWCWKWHPKQALIPPSDNLDDGSHIQWLL